MPVSDHFILKTCTILSVTWNISPKAIWKASAYPLLLHKETHSFPDRLADMFIFKLWDGLNNHSCSLKSWINHNTWQKQNYNLELKAEFKSESEVLSQCWSAQCPKPNPNFLWLNVVFPAFCSFEQSASVRRYRTANQNHMLNIHRVCQHYSWLTELTNALLFGPFVLAVTLTLLARHLKVNLNVSALALFYDRKSMEIFMCFSEN